MRSALADNGNDIISGKSDRLSKISSSVKRPLHSNSKMKLEDQKSAGEKSPKSSKRAKAKEDYFSEVSMKRTSDKFDLLSTNKIKESSMTQHKDQMFNTSKRSL